MASDASPGAERARLASERFRDSMERIRTRTDTGAKVLGGIASAAVVAVGYARLADFYPDFGPPWATWVLIGGVVLMLVALGFFLRRLYGATQAVITSADRKWTEKENDLDPREREILEEAYSAVASANGAASLDDLEHRGRRLERCVEQGEDGATKQWRGQADRILAEVQLAQDRAGAFILRRRATRALFHFWSIALVALFVLGWYAMAVSADAMQSKREGEVAHAKACGEALKAVGFRPVALPASCDESIAMASSEEIVKSAEAALGDAMKACRQAAAVSNQGAEECARLVLAPAGKAPTGG